MADTFTSKTIPFELVSPEAILTSEDASMVVIPGEAGDFGVLADHAPMLSSLRPGVVSVHLPSGEVKKIFVAGGFADVNGKVCSVLAEEAVNVAELSRAQLEDALKNAQSDLDFAKEDALKSSQLHQQIATIQAKLAAVA